MRLKDMKEMNDLDMYILFKLFNNNLDIYYYIAIGDFTDDLDMHVQI